MQAKLERGKAASGGRSVVRSGAILAAGVSLVAALALSAPERALAACGASHPAHMSGGGGGGVHAATSRPAASGGGGGGGGGGSLGCANGASAPALRGLPMASSGRVVEMGAHGTHAAMRPRSAPSRPMNATAAHLRGVRPPRA